MGLLRPQLTTISNEQALLQAQINSLREQVDHLTAVGRVHHMTRLPQRMDAQEQYTGYLQERVAALEQRLGWR